MKVNKCWATETGACRGRITGEHIVSNTLLDESITVQGFSWCKDSPKSIGSASFVSNFLCEEHNHSLSPTDSESKRFTDAITKYHNTTNIIDKWGFQIKKVPYIYEINGRLLEKWFCKTLINISLINEKEAVIHFDKILPILFSDDQFTKPYGLNFAVRTDQSIRLNSPLQITPLFNTISGGEKELSGGLFVFRGIHFILLLPCSSEQIKNNMLPLSFANQIKGSGWEGLQLNWHNHAMQQFRNRGKRSYKVQEIKINW